MAKWVIRDSGGEAYCVESDAIDTDSAGSVIFYNTDEGEIRAILTPTNFIYPAPKGVTHGRADNE